MQYSDGQDVLIGDRVKLGHDDSGIVVCVIEDHAYSDKFSQDEWGYLKHGALIQFRQHGLIHYKELESDVEFLERGTLNPG